MSPEHNPSDEDPHGECRHEIQRLEAENAKYRSAIERLRTVRMWFALEYAGRVVKDVDIAAILQEIDNAQPAD